MKIAILSTVSGEYSWAGSEELWKLLGLEALRNGHEVAVYLQRSFAESPELDDFKVVGGQAHGYEHPGWLQRRLASKKLYSRFGALRRWSPDVLCLSGGPEQPFHQKDVRDLLDSWSGPVVHIIQGNEEGWITGQTRGWCRDLYERAAAIVCVSEANANLLQRQLATELRNIVILPNPIRGRLAEPLPWPESQDEVFRFATVGRYEASIKGQALSLEALSDPVWKERAWHLSFYGSGPDEGYIADLIRYFGLQDRVTIKGFERDFTKIWKSEHLHILCSHNEGLALALVESMFCGRPAVVSRSGGNHELVRDGVDGYVCHGTNSYMLGQVLETAWANRSKWKSMGLAAFGRVSGFVPDDLASRLFSVVTKAAETSKY